MVIIRKWDGEDVSLGGRAASVFLTSLLKQTRWLLTSPQAFLLLNHHKRGRLPPGLPLSGTDLLLSQLAPGSVPEMLLDKETDMLDRATGLRDQGRGHLPDMPHALPDF